MTKISYSRHGDYYLPDLTLPGQGNCFIGKYGLLRKSHLKTYRKILYINLLTSGKLNKHLTEIEKQSNEILDLLINQMAISQISGKKCKRTGIAAEQMDGMKEIWVYWFHLR